MLKRGVVLVFVLLFFNLPFAEAVSTNACLIPNERNHETLVDRILSYLGSMGWDEKPAVTVNNLDRVVNAGVVSNPGWDKVKLTQSGYIKILQKPDVSYAEKENAVWALARMGKYGVIGKPVAGMINMQEEPDVNRFKKFAKLINELHDWEDAEKRSDVARETIFKNLDFRSVYYLLTFGGFDIYTSGFEKVYCFNLVKCSGKIAPKYPNFLDEIKEIDPEQEYALGFVLTLAKYNKLKGLIDEDPEFYILLIKKALQEEDQANLRNNGMLLVNTIRAIFTEPGLSEYKRDMENFLIEQYNKKEESLVGKLWNKIRGYIWPRNTPIDTAVLGFNIKLNKDDFSDANKQRALEIADALPEIIEPVVPQDWLEDDKLVAKLYITQKGQLGATRSNLINNYGFKASKSSGLNILSKKVNGVTLQIVLTSDTSDVKQAVNDPGIDIISHRGHSYQESDVFNSQATSDQNKLVFMGACGGYGRVCDVQRIMPKAYFLSDEDVARGVVNDRITVRLMESIAKRKSQSEISWDGVEGDIQKNYPELASSGLVFPNHDEFLLNPFIQETLEQEFA